MKFFGGNDEKGAEQGERHVEEASKSKDAERRGSDSSEDSILHAFTEREQRHIVHRIDRRLIPIAGMLYCVSLLDRSNLGNAAIAGMSEDLSLDQDNRYSIVTLVFFITYVFFQAPATICIRKIGPRNWITCITIAWGALVIGFGFVPTWGTLLGLRMVLGILEAGFFPGMVYLLSTWYSRYDVAKRYAVFYVIGCGASALGGILAFGLMQMDGLQGLAGWRWIFIIEGVITCLVGIAGFMLLLSFPDDTAARSLRFLKPSELRFIIARVNKDRGDVQPDAFNLKRFLSAGADWKIWAYAFIFGSTTTVTYALAYFLPIILDDAMGFDTGTAQCLVAPPYVFAGILMYATAWISDRKRQRGLWLCINSAVAITGLPIMGFAGSPAVRYFGVFLATAGANANVPISLSYQANNIRGQWKRAFCSATLVGMGGVGGIVGSTVYREQDSPDYVPGLGVSIGANVVIVALVLILSWNFRRQNAKADRGEVILEGEEGFRYTF